MNQLLVAQFQGIERLVGLVRPADEKDNALAFGNTLGISSYAVVQCRAFGGKLFRTLCNGDCQTAGSLIVLYKLFDCLRKFLFANFILFDFCKFNIVIMCFH